MGIVRRSNCGCKNKMIFVKSIVEAPTPAIDLLNLSNFSIISTKFNDIRQRRKVRMSSENIDLCITFIAKDLLYHTSVMHFGESCLHSQRGQT